MFKYIINGLFLTQQITGIQRYAFEICKELDKLADKNHLAIVVPKCCSCEKISFKNIRVIKYGRLNGIPWEQIELRRFALKYHIRCINFCNVTPIGIMPGITVIHDIMFKLHPEWFTTTRNRLSRIWHVFQADYALKHEKLIIVPSNYTKKVLENNYPHRKITVISPAWQHIKNISSNDTWEKKYPFLNANEYFFSVSTRSQNKNGQWIIKTAQNHPGCIFAIAGKSYETNETDLPLNVHMLGYIPDEDICALIKNCKAFIFPSLCEGFGIPPLEALALHADIVVSNTSSLPEIFENSVHYINPQTAHTDLDSLLKENVNPAEYVLKKYSWSKSAARLYKILCHMDGKPGLKHEY